MDKKDKIKKINNNEDFDIIYDNIKNFLIEFANINQSLINGNQNENNLDKIFSYINDSPFKPEECKICQLEDYDDIIKYYSKMLKNFGYYFTEYIFHIKEILKRLILIEPVIKMILIIINENKLNLYNELIKFYINHIFEFYSNKDIDSISHDISLYTTSLYLLKTNFNIKENIDVNYDILKTNSLVTIFHNSIKEINKEIAKIMKNIIKNNKKQINLKIYENVYNELLTNKFSYEFFDKSYFDFLTQNNLEEKLNLIKPFVNKNNFSKYFLKRLNKLLELSKDINYKTSLLIYHLNFDKNNSDNVNQIIDEMIDCLKIYKNYLKAFNKNKYFNTLFKKLLNDNKFRTLFYKIIKSKKIKNFIEKKNFLYNNLENNYNEFINKFIDSNKFFDYVILITLSYYKKAYIDDFLRIFINDNFIRIQGNLNIEITENEIEEISISYLIITLLHESFHFINRFNNSGKSSKKDFSPLSTDTNEKEIGIDLIFFIFNVKIIQELNVENSKYINNIENWENDNFSFHDLNMQDDENNEFTKGLKFMNLKKKNNKKRNLLNDIKRF